MSKETNELLEQYSDALSSMTDDALTQLIEEGYLDVEDLLEITGVLALASKEHDNTISVERVQHALDLMMLEPDEEEEDVESEFDANVNMFEIATILDKLYDLAVESPSLTFAQLLNTFEEFDFVDFSNQELIDLLEEDTDERVSVEDFSVVFDTNVFDKPNIMEDTPTYTDEDLMKILGLSSF